VAWRCSTSGFLEEVAARIDAMMSAAVRWEFSVADERTRGREAYLQDDDEETFAQGPSELHWLAGLSHRTVDAGLDLSVILN
jgi:hypothetical protein